MTNQTMTKMVLDTWHSKIKDADTLFEKLTDEQMQNEVAPNRNSGVYLLGHLTAVHDMMLPLLGLGEQMYPELKDTFISNPDKSQPQKFSLNDLRQYWKNINSKLAMHFNNLKTDEWFQKHNSVSAEDFIKEPHRNKLNIVINRTNHLSYHLGQLAFLN
jgi:hypothetical protein